MSTESVKSLFLIFNLLIFFLDLAVIEGKTLDPIYWNSSNPMFKANDRRRYYQVNAAINDKLDLICPRKNRGDGEELFYYKLFLVSEENFRMCNTSGQTRLLTCDVPEQEKKYTFFFQEISPSPWGLEFQPGKSYYVVSTSDGSQSGMDGQKGGVCTRFNMRIELKISSSKDPVLKPSIVKPPRTNPSPPLLPNQPKVPRFQPEKNQFVNSPKNTHALDRNVEPIPNVGDNDNADSTENGQNDQVSGSGMIIGVVLGAFAVLFFLVLGFLGYKVYKKRRQHKKYQSPPLSPRGATPMQQVTLLPIVPPSHHARLHSDVERHRTGTLSSHADMRPPPSYNESFLDNGGPVVAV